MPRVFSGFCFFPHYATATFLKVFSTYAFLLWFPTLTAYFVEWSLWMNNIKLLWKISAFWMKHLGNPIKPSKLRCMVRLPEVDGRWVWFYWHHTRCIRAGYCQCATSCGETKLETIHLFVDKLRYFWGTSSKGKFFLFSPTAIFILENWWKY